jgi:hypothetical protein
VSARWDDGLEDEAQALPQEDLDVICEIANQLPLELNGYSWSDMTEREAQQDARTIMAALFRAKKGATRQ